MEVLIFGAASIVSFAGFLYGLAYGKNEKKEARGARIGWYGLVVMVFSGSVLAWHLL